jgi:hypothetical protein
VGIIRNSDISDRLEMLSVIKFTLNHGTKGKQHVIRQDNRVSKTLQLYGKREFRRHLKTTCNCIRLLGYISGQRGEGGGGNCDEVDNNYYLYQTQIYVNIPEK